MTITNCIRDFIDGRALKVPIFTSEIYEYVAEEIPAADKRVVNEYIVRYAKSHPDFVRFRKGIYYKTENTPFGRPGIDVTELIRKIYLYKGQDVIGYETGPSYMNKIGLTTQIPKYTFITTENNRTKAIGREEGYFFLTPVIKITTENFRYLQLLDMIDNRFKVHIERENCYKVYRKFIEIHTLEYEKLLNYARLYRNDIIYREIARTAKGEVS